MFFPIIRTIIIANLLEILAVGSCIATSNGEETAHGLKHTILSVKHGGVWLSVESGH